MLSAGSQDDQVNDLEASKNEEVQQILVGLSKVLEQPKVLPPYSGEGGQTIESEKVLTRRVTTEAVVDLIGLFPNIPP